MADEFAEIRDMRERFIRAAYNRRNPGQDGAAPNDDIMRDLGLDPLDMCDTDQYEDIVSFWV
jgi:hypothetical protein